MCKGAFSSVSRVRSSSIRTHTRQRSVPFQVFYFSTFLLFVVSRTYTVPVLEVSSLRPPTFIIIIVALLLFFFCLCKLLCARVSRLLFLIFIPDLVHQHLRILSLLVSSLCLSLTHLNVFLSSIAPACNSVFFFLLSFFWFEALDLLLVLLLHFE